MQALTPEIRVLVQQMAEQAKRPAHTGPPLPSSGGIIGSVPTGAPPPLPPRLGGAAPPITPTRIRVGGNVQQAKLIRLAPAAIEAVEQWVYQPTLLNGEPVEVVTQIDVNFTLCQDGGKSVFA